MSTPYTGPERRSTPRPTRKSSFQRVLDITFETLRRQESTRPKVPPSSTIDSKTKEA